jgi:ABC-type transport system substrate-binding protein
VVTVSGTYTAVPTATGYSALPPRLVVPAGATLVSESNSSTTLTASASFAIPGTYELTMVGPIASPNGTIFQNYTWSIYVGPTGEPLGCLFCRNSGGVGSAGASPHPGSLYAYEIVPGGATSLDPAVDYESTGGEILQNVFETLVDYNASSTSGYVPVLSTCIPGPAASGPTSCQSQYGSDLNTGANGTYWTFPIDPNASFYDPGTGAHWGVYPSDVMFSVARTLMWLENPSQYTTNGWIIGQSMLPFGNKHWDGGLHAPWNNTPQNVLTSMMVNDSTYCPAKALAQHGCITFKAAGSGQVWPYFLEFVQGSEGASVVPCGWYTRQGAGLPGFTTNAAGGDGPCLLPGGVRTTNTSAFKSYVTGASPTLYDSIIGLDTINYQNPYPQVRWNIVGSGPYWLQSVNQGQGYILKANPYYVQPNCAGLPGCFPVPASYASQVYAFWDPDSTTGINAYEAGQSDTSSFVPSDLPLLLHLQSQGRISLYRAPTLNIFPEAFAFDFNPAAVQSNSGILTNVPGDFFAWVGMREFFAEAFPYSSYINVDNRVDGIPFIQGEGGAIPQYMGNYYPQNISWPGLNTTHGLWPQTWQNPSENPLQVGSAAWWWANITQVNSPFYDPEAAHCKVTICRFPMSSEIGSVPFDSAVDLWSSVVNATTHGAIQFIRWDGCGFSGWCYNCPGFFGPPDDCTSFLTGWLPDYPDPTDYMSPFYLPDGSWTYPSQLSETLVTGQYGGVYDLCSAHAGYTFENLVYWADQQPIVPQTCQGTAYSVMTWAMEQAGVMAEGPQRVLYYNLIEHVANGLVLYVYDEQQVGLVSTASWIDPSTVDLNPMALGQLWFQWHGNNVV